MPSKENSLTKKKIRNSRDGGCPPLRLFKAEATSGQGMLMVSASGSAVKIGKADKDFEEAWKVFADSNSQK